MNNKINNNNNNYNNKIQKQEVGVSLEYLESIASAYEVTDLETTHQVKVRCFFNIFALSNLSHGDANFEVPSIADLYVPESQKGLATDFVTHSYRDNFMQLVRALQKEEKEAKGKFFFIDLFCLSFSLDNESEVYY